MDSAAEEGNSTLKEHWLGMPILLQNEGSTASPCREYCWLPGRGTLRRIHQYRGVYGAALRQIRALPEWHVDWEKRLDPNGSAFDHTTAEMPQ